MKKILSFVLAVLMLAMSALCFAGCGETEQTDSAYIAEKGKLVVGVTVFEPMDYKDESGAWAGFDADAAKLFAETLGAEAEIVIINWDTKAFELNNKNIDCVWNGMTLTDDVKAQMETSNPYFNNAQVVIVNAAIAEQCKTAEDCKNLKFAVEVGSAGEDAAKANGFSYTSVENQASALMEVASGTSDAAIVDFLMAVCSVGEGTSYPTLTYTVSLTTEEYVVGFRKGSDLAAKLNAFFTDQSAELVAIAEKYGIADYLILQ